MTAEIVLPNAKSDISETDHEIKIEIKVPQRQNVINRMIIWSLFYGFGQIYLIVVAWIKVFKPGNHTDSVTKMIAIAMLLLWSLGSYFALWEIFKNLMGRNTIKINSSTLTIIEKAGPFKKVKEYDTTHINNLRILEETTPYCSSFSDKEEGGGPGLGFDYKEKTIEFARFLNVGELKSLLDVIKVKLA